MNARFDQLPNFQIAEIRITRPSLCGAYEIAFFAAGGQFLTTRISTRCSLEVTALVSAALARAAEFEKKG